MVKITPLHKTKLEEISRQLATIGSKESAFTAVEILFYDALSIAGSISQDTSQNPLLAGLRQMQEKEYQETKEHFKKSSQREKVIRRFMARFKSILTTSVKTMSMQASATL
jgi:hypothetical protein